MEEKNFNYFLLKTAFAVMACDGDIDKKEIEKIKSLAKNENFFGDINIAEELSRMLSELKKKGKKFFQDYFSQIEKSEFSKDEELKIVEISIAIINADEKVEYNEIKFFKVIRSSLKLSNEEILEKMPEIEEFLEDDILSKSYISKLKYNYFNFLELPTLKIIDIDFNRDE